jgi:hypothetical protein
VDIGSSWILVELVPDQMNGATLSSDNDFPTRAPGTSDVTLMSFTTEASYSCHPAWFPEGDVVGTAVPSPRWPLVLMESDVLMRTDAMASDEL